MTGSFDIDPVVRIATGAVGEPGRRVFYLQARSEDQLVTLLVEKEQVRALAVSIEQMLAAIPAGSRADEPAEAAPVDAGLEEPLLPEWRVGPMALQYDEDRDRIVLIASEQLEIVEGESDPEAEVATARFVATREQAAALSEQAGRVVEAGRPACRFCGLPMDPEGHTCPAMNGHRG